MSTEHKRREAEKRLERFKLSEAVVLAFVPVLAQMLVFSYDSGYLSVFHLPLQFIELNWVRTFTVMVSVLGGLAFLRSFSSLGFIIWQHVKSLMPVSIAQSLSKIFVVLLVYLVFLFVTLTYKCSIWVWILTGVPVLGFAFLELVFPLITQRKKGAYAEKLQAQQEIEDLTEALEDKFIQFVGKRLTLVGITVVIGFLVAFGMGRRAAMNQRLFYVISTSPEMAVLWMTGDKAVASPFDRQTQEVEPAFTVFEIAAKDSIMFRFEEVGPLQLQEKPTYSGPALGSTPTPMLTPTLTSTLIPSPTLSPTSTLFSSPILSP